MLCLSALLCHHLNPHLQLPAGSGKSPPDLFTCWDISINYPHASPSCRKHLSHTDLKLSMHGGFGIAHILVSSSTPQHLLPGLKDGLFLFSEPWPLIQGLAERKRSQRRAACLHPGVHQGQSSLQEHPNFKVGEGSDAAQTISCGFNLNFFFFFVFAWTSRGSERVGGKEFKSQPKPLHPDPHFHSALN